MYTAAKYRDNAFLISVRARRNNLHVSELVLIAKELLPQMSSNEDIWWCVQKSCSYPNISYNWGTKKGREGESQE